MKTVIFGKINTKKYELVSGMEFVDSHEEGDSKVLFTHKPYIETTTETTRTKEICSFEGEICYNLNTPMDINSGNPFSPYFNKKFINISEDTEVLIEKEIFRADLNENHVFTDHVCDTEEQCKECVEKELEEVMATFNETMINSSEIMKSYCKIHKLDIKKISFDELFHIIYPGKTYEVKGDKFIVLDVR